MSKKIIVQEPLHTSNQVFPEQKAPIYPIYIENDYTNLPQILSQLQTDKCKLLLITDSNVAPIYADNVQTILTDHSACTYSITIPSGEKHKNLETIENIYDFLIQKSFDRNDIIFALGGGVIGDMTGYAAATYLRGIRFVQLPTSLLSMVDSSIGGKTGVDYKSYKNMVGAFHQPQAVYINLSVLSSLPDREFYSGFGEIIKHGLIKDADYFHYLVEHVSSIQNKESSILEEVIYRSCKIKQEVVENDPKEKNERALLNFGHTIGHAIEKFMDFSLLHGECVGIGMVAASYISYLRAYISKEDFEAILSVLEAYHLPAVVTIDDTKFDRFELLSIVKHDKKMFAGQIKFILLKELGNAFIDSAVTEEELTKAFSFIMGVRY